MSEEFPVEMWLAYGVYFVVVVGFLLWCVNKAFPYDKGGQP
jgi:hypothetical protein